jgi:hypothetical protein
MVTTTRNRSLFIAGCTLGCLFLGAGCNAILGITSANEEAIGVDAAPTGPSCEVYCATVVQNCPNDEYNDVPTCLALCNAGAIDRGQLTDTTIDSIGCRQHYAALAAKDPSNCRAAGPLGGGVCGAPCESFCALDTAECLGPNAQYSGPSGCESTCAAEFPVYLTDAGNDLALDMGDTLNCRIWHLQAAVAPDDSGTLLAKHCPHTGIPDANAYCF